MLGCIAALYQLVGAAEARNGYRAISSAKILCQQRCEYLVRACYAIAEAYDQDSYKVFPTAFASNGCGVVYLLDG
ncbi:hypothetical protein BDW68DRAFT_168480 [Aspergillus falconensis]